MIDMNIVDMLSEMSKTTVARLSPASELQSDNAPVRRAAILRSIRDTILPRHLEFVAADGTRLVLEVSSARVVEILEFNGKTLPDFEKDERVFVTQAIAEVITEFSAVPGPLELLALHPDTSPDADDVGITFNEVERACDKLELSEESGEDSPALQATADAAESIQKTPRADVVATPAVAKDALCPSFFEGSKGFALERFQMAADGSLKAAGEGSNGEVSFNPDADILTQFARDLSIWGEDCGAALQGPQMILMRSADKKASSLAVVRDDKDISIAMYEARKLGAAVGLWKSLTKKQEN
ncbi:hypothetical protein ROA7450_01051 [Roseovarius albus]|uniref:Uncharacterized protein n=1 Tax=Roseovarius albus TaxID=1247867 RepID=A0A1X6YN44_9RHOB|nr:hypothetical protein [Roseovarius albus]SLN25379.1 hypothetical protein ROA7450_01051 [Roseovarius albus]